MNPDEIEDIAAAMEREEVGRDLLEHLDRQREAEVSTLLQELEAALDAKLAAAEGDGECPEAA